MTDTMSATSVEARRGDLRMLLGLERLAPGRFVGSRYQLNINGSIYGGQIFAQALNAAFETVEGRVAHSVQASFLRPAVDGVPIEYEVANMLDGASYSMRYVQASQNGKPLLALTASFKTSEDAALDHPDHMSDPWPDPEALRNLDQQLGGDASSTGSRTLPRFPDVEVRPCMPDRYLLRVGGPPQHDAWVRAVGKLSDEAADHQTAIAYLSDFGMTFPVMTPYVEQVRKTPLRYATLNHSLWFHGHSSALDWIAFRTIGSWAGDGRCLHHGRMYDRSGNLVASVAQEALIRRISR